MRILISRPDRIGDVVLSTPIPRALKKRYPDCYVAVLVKEYTKDIYLHNPYVDAILTIDDLLTGKVSFWDKVKEIKKYNFTHSLALLPNQKINYLLFFAGIRYRIGEGTRLYQYLTFTRSVSRKHYKPLRHEADYCMDLARKIGVTTDRIASQIFLSPEEEKEVEELKFNYLAGKKYLIGVHSSSGNSAPNLPVEKYKTLILMLKQNTDYRIAVTDNVIPDELKKIDDVIYPNVGLSLRESIKRFATLDSLISASTGPMHLCAGLKVKTVSLFCPLTACSPELWGPQGNENIIIQPTEDFCRNTCPKDPKKCNFTGVGGIGPEEVKNALQCIIYNV